MSKLVFGDGTLSSDWLVVFGGKFNGFDVDQLVRNIDLITRGMPVQKNIVHVEHVTACHVSHTSDNRLQDQNSADHQHILSTRNISCFMCLVTSVSPLFMS